VALRYLALIAPKGLDFIGGDTERKASALLGSWDTVLDTKFVRAWVRSPERGSFSYRPLSAPEGNGCLIGRDFALDASGLEDSPLHSDALLGSRWGAYVAIRVDENTSRVRILRDPTGRLTCWTAAVGDLTLVFSHFEDALQILDARPPLDWEYLRFHLLNRCFHGRGTAYSGVTEILPGDEATFEGTGNSFSRAWRPEQFGSDPQLDIDQARKQFRVSAERVVEDWSRDYRSITLDLSGGLDSAIVLGLLRKYARHPTVIGVNYVIPHAEGDERSWARDAAKLHGIELLEEDVSKAILLPATTSHNQLMRPAVRSLPLGYDQVGTRVARQTNCDAFFTGTGGDHVFHHSASSAIVFDYMRSEGITGLINFTHQVSQISRVTIWRTFAQLMAQKFGKLERPINSFIKPSPLLTDNFEDSDRLERYLHPTIIEATEGISRERSLQILNILELQTHYWRYGRAAACDEIHPLFSQPLLEASLRTPLHWFLEGATRRGLARTAFRDLIPSSIFSRRSKGSNSSHWVEVFEHHLPRFREMLLEGHLAKAGLINRSEIEATLKPLALVESNHFGTLVNVLSVEQWLEEQ
jgi:asparagine synthase (glutamine-hydrolysing)